MYTYSKYIHTLKHSYVHITIPPPPAAGSVDMQYRNVSACSYVYVYIMRTCIHTLHIHIYTYIYIYIHIHIYIHIRIYTYICIIPPSPAAGSVDMRYRNVSACPSKDGPFVIFSTLKKDLKDSIDAPSVGLIVCAKNISVFGPASLCVGESLSVPYNKRDLKKWSTQKEGYLCMLHVSGEICFGFRKYLEVAVVYLERELQRDLH